MSSLVSGIFIKFTRKLFFYEYTKMEGRKSMFLWFICLGISCFIYEKKFPPEMQFQIAGMFYCTGTLAPTYKL